MIDPIRTSSFKQSNFENTDSSRLFSKKFPDILITQSCSQLPPFRKLIFRFCSLWGVTFWIRIKKWFWSCWNSFKDMVLIFCCRNTKKIALVKLGKIHVLLLKKIKLVKEGKLSKNQLSEWWENQYFSLSNYHQTLLLLEDVKVRCPSDFPNPNYWAEKNLSEYQGKAIDFVLKLFVQKESQGFFDPLDHLPIYLSNVIEKLKNQ